MENAKRKADSARLWRQDENTAAGDYSKLTEAALKECMSSNVRRPKTNTVPKYFHRKLKRSWAWHVRMNEIGNWKKQNPNFTFKVRLSKTVIVAKDKLTLALPSNSPQKKNSPKAVVTPSFRTNCSHEVLEPLSVPFKENLVEINKQAQSKLFSRSIVGLIYTSKDGVTSTSG